VSRLRHDDHGWRRQLAVARRYKRLVVLMTVVGVAAGVAGTRFVQPVEVAYLQLVALAFLGCLGLLILGAVLLGRTDRTVRTPDQVRDELGLTLLGTVPRVAAGDPRNGTPDDAEVGEAFRVVRRNLLHVHGKTEPAIVALTSLAAAEGKSFVSSNLARELSALGRRTLVIDADVGRRNGRHPNGGRRAPGLTEYLAGRATLDQAIHAADDGVFDWIGSGPPAPNASKLLQSRAMAGLLDALRSSYEAILIKTSPLDGGPEPVALARLAGSLVVVLRAGATDRGAAMAQLEMLDSLPINLLGAVLNDVPQNGTGRPRRREPAGNETWDREQIKVWQHVQQAEAAAAGGDGRPDVPRPGKVYQPNGSSRSNGSSGNGRAAPAADEAIEEAASVDPAEAPAAPVVPAGQAESNEPAVTQAEATQGEPPPAPDEDDIWYEPEWDLWYNPDWHVRARHEVREPPAARPVAKANGGGAAREPEVQPPPSDGHLDFSLDTLTLEPLTPGANGGNAGNSEGDSAAERRRTEERRRAEDRRQSEARRLNGDRRVNGGRGEERLEAYAAGQVESFREHQRRHHQRLWK